MTKSLCKIPHPLAISSTNALLRDGCYAKREFCSIKLKQGSLENYMIIENMINIRTTLCGTKLADHLIKSYQLDFCPSSALTPAKSIDDVQV